MTAAAEEDTFADEAQAPPRRSGPARVSVSRSTRLSVEEEQLLRPPPILVQWRGLTYTPWVRSGNSRKRQAVFSNIHSAARPGHLCALMGPSGAGKTSLLTVLAGFCDPSDVAGIILVNGRQSRALPKRRVGFVFQEDLLLSSLTPYEIVMFAAALKLPGSIRPSARKERVNALLDLLSLRHVADKVVGSPTSVRRGISGGERKRVAIASEMVTGPSLLIADEATSGLDATTALSTMTALRTLANTGLTVMVSIHQPQTRIFSLFDTLLLMHGGTAVFDGPASGAVPFFEHRLSMQLPPQTNAADWLLDLCVQVLPKPSSTETGAGSISSSAALHWGDSGLLGRLVSLFRSCGRGRTPRNSSSVAGSDTGGNMQPFDGAALSSSRTPSYADLTDLDGSTQGGALAMEALPEELPGTGGPKFATGFLTQLSVLLLRCNKQQRGSSLTLVSACQAAGQAFLTSILWAQLPHTDAFVSERLSLLFFLLIAIGNVAVNASIATFSSERPLLVRERAKGMYRMSAYFLAKTLTDGANTVLLPILVVICVYWAAGLKPTAPAFFTFLSGFTLSLLVAQSMGLALSIVIRETQFALVLAPTITLYSLIAGGFYIRLDRFPGWLMWISRLSFARYAYTGLVVNEFRDSSFPCATANTPLYGTTCPVPGQAVIANQAMSGENIGFNYAMLIVFQVGLRLASYVCLRYDIHIL